MVYILNTTRARESTLHRKNNFIKESKNLARYRFENNFVDKIIT